MLRFCLGVVHRCSILSYGRPIVKPAMFVTARTGEYQYEWRYQARFA
jgi:hypothetical protein